MAMQQLNESDALLHLLGAACSRRRCCASPLVHPNNQPMPASSFCGPPVAVSLIVLSEMSRLVVRREGNKY